MTHYKEHQVFPVWAYLAAFLGPLIVHGIALATNEAFPPWAYGALWGFSLLIANLLYMRTEITASTLMVRFGFAFTYYRKRFPLAEVSVLRTVTYRPLLDAGGWGIRWGRFEGKPCRYLNARGNRGVLMGTPKHRFIIGSQATEDLAQALLEAGCASE